MLITTEYVNPIAQSLRLADEEHLLNIHICEHTNCETLFIKDGEEIMCLHNETIADDRADVTEFRKTLS